MPAFLIADIQVHNPQRYKDYTALTPALMERHGGKFRVRGGEHRITEGEWSPGRLVLVEFPSYEAANNFVSDPEYLAAAKIRQEASTGNMLIVNGV